MLGVKSRRIDQIGPFPEVMFSRTQKSSIGLGTLAQRGDRDELAFGGALSHGRDHFLAGMIGCLADRFGFGEAESFADGRVATHVFNREVKVVVLEVLLDSDGGNSDSCGG